MSMGMLRLFCYFAGTGWVGQKGFLLLERPFLGPLAGEDRSSMETAFTRHVVISSLVTSTEPGKDTAVL